MRKKTGKPRRVVLRHDSVGTCSKQVKVIIEGQTIRSVEFTGGCSGNLKGIAALAEGREAGDVAKLLEGIQCRNGTSCPDQLAKALAAVGKAKRKA